MENEITPTESGDREVTSSLASFARGLSSFLKGTGLPDQGILVDLPQRTTVIQNLGNVLQPLVQEDRSNAQYISKFVAAAACGLFDAALNYIWDETIKNLRTKAAHFDLVYFFDTAVENPDRRKMFLDERDLTKLDDWELIRACMMLGLVGEVGFKHLDYIRMMRNWASAAHPNQNEITGLQLASWAETCVKEVISKKPDPLSTSVHKLLRSLREENLDQSHVAAIASGLQRLTADLSSSLLRTVFGMFADVKIAAQVKANILLIAKPLWEVAPDAARSEAGIKCATYHTNGEALKHKDARRFLDHVGGLSYLPAEARALELATALQNLRHMHWGWNNFYNEPPYARIVRSLVPSTGEIPASAKGDYVKTVILCRLGNGHGVSIDAEPVYDEMLAMFDEALIANSALWVGWDNNISSRLQFQSCVRNLKQIASSFLPRITNTHIRAAIQYLIAYPGPSMDKIRLESGYRNLVTKIYPTLKLP